MRRSLTVIVAIAIGVIGGLIAAWQRTSSSEPPLTANQPEAASPVERDDQPRSMRWASRESLVAGTLEVEVRRDGQAASGVEVQVFRLERTDGAPSSHWGQPLHGVTTAHGLTRFEVPPSRHLVVARLTKPITKQIDVAPGSTPDHLVLEAGDQVDLAGTTIDAESTAPLGGVEVIWRPEVAAPAPEISTIRSQADSLGRFGLTVPSDPPRHARSDCAGVFDGSRSKPCEKAVGAFARARKPRARRGARERRCAGRGRLRSLTTQ